MTAKEAIRQTIQLCYNVTDTYISDLSDADLLVRPVPGMNHVAWQLGHLIVSTHEMLAGLGRRPPELPAGFAAAHSRETTRVDDPTKFAKKADYVALRKQMQSAVLAAVDATPEVDLTLPGPESMRSYAPTVAAVLALLGTHDLMHGAQFVAVRRMLGKPVLI